MPKYERNHYVPQWYQNLFLNGIERENKFYYLDLKPESKCAPNGKIYKRKALLRWGPDSCFYEKDLYKIKFQNFDSTEIEESFFGSIDNNGKKSVEYFGNLIIPDGGMHEAFNSFIPYLSAQKMRTPKGLAHLASIVRNGDKNIILQSMVKFHQMHCAIWAEAIWCIAEIGESSTNFIISDHPVTVYNQECFPGSKMCRAHNDPDIWLNGTHTIFPLSSKRILILTNLSWLRNPYGNPLEPRPNPNLFRPAFFDFSSIHSKRILNETEVVAINHIIKQRAFRYIASAKEEWLYPEEYFNFRNWDEIGLRYVLMPDPRSVSFRTNILMGYKNGSVDAADEYGRKPWDANYSNKANDMEWHTFHAFQGEYARIFGPKRKSVSFEFGKECKLEDSPEYHKYHLGLEQIHKAFFKRPRSKNYKRKERRKK